MLSHALLCFALLGGGCCSQLASYQWTQLMMPIAAILAHNCHHRPESHHHLHYPHFPFFTVLKILTGNMSSWKKYIFHICYWLTLLNCVKKETQDNSCIHTCLKRYYLIVREWNTVIKEGERKYVLHDIKQLHSPFLDSLKGVRLMLIISKLDPEIKRNIWQDICCSWYILSL